MTEDELRQEIKRLSREINTKFRLIREARDAAGLKPGDPLLGLTFPFLEDESKEVKR